MKYRVTVLTPTLVGDGTRLSPIDYMVWRDQVNVLDQSRIFKLLSKGPRLEPYLAQLRRATTLDFASWGGFAQNFADRRIPFEDAAYTPVWNKATADSLHIPTFRSNESGPYIPGSALKGALRNGFGFSNGSERVFSISDSKPSSRDAFRVYLLRVSKLIAKGIDWKPTPTFAEMAGPGTVFEGEWKESEFLNGEEVRKMLRWREPVTTQKLFESANQHAAKQLEQHAEYAKLAGLDDLAPAVADLQNRKSDGCLLCIGWAGGLLSKAIPSEQMKNGFVFPKTRRIVFLKNKPATLPGWVELSVS